MDWPPDEASMVGNIFMLLEVGQFLCNVVELSLLMLRLNVKC